MTELEQTVTQQATTDPLPGTNVRVLIVAEHASMRFGGEASLPLHWFTGLRKLHVECWLLVHERTRAELEQLLDADAARVYYVPDLWVHRFLCRLGSRLPSRVSYFTTGWLMHLATQVMQRKLAKQLVRKHDIDVVHEPIPVSPRLPSMMYDPGAPVVIGPMNGNMSYPLGFRERASLLERYFIQVGRQFTDLANWLIPGKRRAALLLVANERTRQGLPRGCRGRVEVLCENGVDTCSWRTTPHIKQLRSGAFRAVFVGRLLQLKGVDLLLEAFVQVKRQYADAELWIIGDGPERAALGRLADRLGISSSVQFHGWVPQVECPSVLQRCHVLVMPSLHDCGGAVVQEAMALGLPVIAADWGGPADYVTPETGILVKPESRSQYVPALASAIVELAGDPAKRQRMGRAGRERVAQEFSWDAKCRWMDARIRQLVGSAVAT